MNVCDRHGRIRCDECAFVDELKERIAELQKEVERLKGWIDTLQDAHGIEKLKLQAETSELQKALTKIKQGIRSSLNAQSQGDAYHILTVTLQEHSDPWKSIEGSEPE